MKLTPARREQLRAYGRKGGKVRAQAFTSDYQKMARSYVRHESNVANGHKGFIACGGAKGWAKANAHAAQWRIAHPSEPERWALDLLTSRNLNHFKREYAVDEDGHTVDLAWPDRKVAVEINGHQSKPSFGESEPRLSNQQRKIESMIEQGWTVIVIDATADRQSEAERLLDFLKVHVYDAEAGHEDELPF